MNPEIPTGPQASSPTSPTTPIPQPPSTPISGGSTPQSYNSMSATVSGKKGLVIGLASGAVALILIAAAGWFLWFSPVAQTKRVSAAFMKALTTKDMNKVYELAGATDDSSKEFLQNAAKKSEGSYTLKDKTMKNGVGYFLYDLSNKDGKQGRTIIEKQDGKYQVTSYVFGSSNLALVPSTSNSNQSTADTSAVTPTTTTSTCLVAADYDGLWMAMNGDSRPTDIIYAPENPDNQYSTNVHFTPDSLNFDNQTAEEATIRNLAVFYTDNPAKAYTFHLQGSVATTAAADLDFSNQRAQKVKQLLEAAGVPDSYIVIDTPQNISDLGVDVNDPVWKETSRNVIATIVPESCSSAPTSAGDR